MKVLFIGDVVGKPGRQTLKTLLPELKKKYLPDVIMLNGENSAAGKGITSKIINFYYELGIDVITSGNHIWDNKDVFEIIDKEDRLLRPANYPEGVPGWGSILYQTAKKQKIGVINLLGRFMVQTLDCPFRTAKNEIDKLKENTNIILVDFHAETTSEKQAMGWYLSGKVSAVVGTHTHVQTADEKILSGGTAYITDVGMTGSFDSVIGIDKELVIQRFITAVPVRFKLAKTGLGLNAVLIDIEDNTGKAVSIIRINETV